MQTTNTIQDNQIVHSSSPVIMSQNNVNNQQTEINQILPNNQQITNTNANEKEEFHESPYRFVIVVVYFLLNFANGTQWVTFSSTADKFRQVYNLHRMLVDLFSMIFMIEYPFACIPEGYIIDNYSMRLGLDLAAGFTILGSFLKIFTNHSIAWAYLGQICSGSFQPAILNSPAKIASVWFKDNSRTLVTSICCVANTIGVLFGYIFHTLFIDNDSYGQKYKDEFYDYVFWEFILVAILCVPTFFFIYSKPKEAVSYSQKDYKSPPLKESLKLLFHNKNFVKFLICSTCIIGFFNIYGTILNPYLALYDISDDDASYAAAAANGFGILSSLIVSVILDKSKAYRNTMVILNIFGLLFMIVLTVLLETVDSKPFIQAIVLFSCIIAFIVPIYTTGMDYVCELTYPVGESISGGLIMCFNQLSGIIGILIADVLIHHCEEYRYLTNILAILMIAGSLVAVFFIEEKLLRNEKENEHKKEIENYPK